jgi:hypothetical protein
MGNDGIYEYLVRTRQQEAQAFVARERLATCLRSVRQPLRLQLSSALRQLGAWCLALPAVLTHRHGRLMPRGLH